jgi:integrase
MHEPPQSQAVTVITPAHYSDDLALAGAVADHYSRQNAFETYRAARSANTVRRQAIDLGLFARYLAAAHVARDGLTLFSDPEAWRGITAGLVEGFVAWQLQEGYAISSVNGRLATIKTYSRLAHKAGAISADMLVAMKHVEGYSHKDGRNIDAGRATTRKGSKKAAWVSLTAAQAVKLKRQPSTTLAGRDALLMYLLLELGLRCGEIAGLSAGSIDLAARTITFYREKVDKLQIHRLGEEAAAAAENYLPSVSIAGPLFPGYKGKPISTRAINDRVRTLGKRIGIENLSPHDCRHYWATSAVRGGTDLKTLQAAGGWSSPVMALHYAEVSVVVNDQVKLG